MKRNRKKKKEEIVKFKKIDIQPIEPVIEKDHKEKEHKEREHKEKGKKKDRKHKKEKREKREKTKTVDAIKEREAFKKN